MRYFIPIYFPRLLHFRRSVEVYYKRPRARSILFRHFLVSRETFYWYKHLVQNMRGEGWSTFLIFGIVRWVLFKTRLRISSCLTIINAIAIATVDGINARFTQIVALVFGATDWTFQFIWISRKTFLIRLSTQARIKTHTLFRSSFLFKGFCCGKFVVAFNRFTFDEFFFTSLSTKFAL